MSVNPFPFLSEFKSSAERIQHERKYRLEIGKKVLNFGIPFLDECLGGILSNDLILIGSKTGTGKTQLACSIAQENIRNGKRVHYFALEAEENEIERRIKYQWIAEKYFQLSTRPKVHLCYLDWYKGLLDTELNAIEKEVELMYPTLENLFTYYRTARFRTEDFLRLALSIQKETDLIIVDHLHYFDHDDMNENKAVKETVVTIRDCALKSGKPVILIAHIRKSDRKSKQIVPDIDDFHGSSDTGKIATKAITIAPSRERRGDGLKTTYVQTLKCRIDGSRQYQTGVLAFNFKSSQYEKPYYIGELSADGSSLRCLSSEELPFWAISAKSPLKKEENKNQPSQPKSKLTQASVQSLVHPAFESDPTTLG